jgi:hypothetical protein
MRRVIVLAFLVSQLTGCGGESGVREEPNAGDQALLQTQQQPVIQYNSVYFHVDSSHPVGQIVATDGEKTYRIGSVTVQQLLEDIIKTDPIRDIYDYMSPAVEHRCSNGSYILDQFRQETILNRLYSYSFGCCSDVNEPMLSSLYLAAGYEGHSFRSPHHVAIEVCDGTGVCHYADVDHDMFYEGGIDVARTLNPGVAYWFEDSKVYKEDGQLRPLAAEGEAIPPTVFIFNPGDYIGFTRLPVELPVLRGYPGEEIYAPPSTSLGVAKLSLVPYEVGRIDECVSFRIRFPYVLVGASVYQRDWTSPIDLPAHGRYELEFEICETDPAADPAKRLLWLSFQYNSNIFPDMNLLTATGATVHKYQ